MAKNVSEDSRKSFSIRLKMVSLVIIAVILTAILTTFIALPYAQKIVLGNLEDSMKSLATSYGLILDYELESNGGVVEDGFYERVYKDVKVNGMESSYIYVVAADGTMLYHPTAEKIGLPVENSVVKELVARMSAGEIIVPKVVSYDYHGLVKYAGYSVAADNSSVLVLTSDQKDALIGVKKIYRHVGIFSLIVIILLAAFSYFFAVNIAKPIEDLAVLLSRYANLDFRKDDVLEKLYNRNDEIGSLTRELTKMLESLIDLLRNISDVAHNVASGALQTSASSTDLAKGAASQASSLEELTATVEEISSQTKQNAQNAAEVSNVVRLTEENANAGNEHMKAMLLSINEIDQSSKEISNIIKVINDIAFQTNILSLNASVEAARAGEYGKGFAVVAEEVRNLAQRSAVAAKEITGMIENSIEKIDEGTEIANETGRDFAVIIEQVGKIVELVQNIASASGEQAIGIEEINKAIAHISKVVQTNSAASQETAASSEALLNQTEVLRQQVDKFTVEELEED